MDSSTPAASVEMALLKNSEIKEEVGRLARQKTSMPGSHAIEEIRSSVARLSSRSVDGLGRLKSELEELQKLLKSEVERVQVEIDSALNGIRIITEVIAPWKSSTSISLMPSAGAGEVHADREASLDEEPA